MTPNYNPRQQLLAVHPKVALSTNITSMEVRHHADILSLFEKTLSLTREEIEEYTKFSLIEETTGRHLYLFDHQLKALYLLLLKSRFMFIMNMGTGKTLTSLAAVYFYKKWKVSRRKCLFLVLSKTAVGGILMDIKNMTHMTACQWDPYATDYPVDIAVTTYAAIRYHVLAAGKNKEDQLQKIRDYQEVFDTFVLDEFHAAKTSDSAITDILYQLVNDIHPLFPPALVCVMTGTPLGKDAREYFSQFKVLDGGATFGLNKAVFTDVYMNTRDKNIRVFDKRSGMMITRTAIKHESKVDMLPTLREKASANSISFHTEEVIILPPFEYHIHRYELTSPTLEYYKKLDDVLSVETPEGTIAPYAHHMQKQQVLSGFLYTRPLEKGESCAPYYKIAFPPKVQEVIHQLKASLRQNPHRVVLLFYHYQVSPIILEQAFKEQSIDYVHIIPGMGIGAVQKLLYQINQSTGQLVILASSGSSGMSLNLQRADTIFYYDIPPQLNVYTQSLWRIRRIGSTGDALHVHFFSALIPGSASEKSFSVEESRLWELTKGINIAATAYSLDSLASLKGRSKMRMVTPKDFELLFQQLQLQQGNTDLAPLRPVVPSAPPVFFSMVKKNPGTEPPLVSAKATNRLATMLKDHAKESPSPVPSFFTMIKPPSKEK